MNPPVEGALHSGATDQTRRSFLRTSAVVAGPAALLAAGVDPAPARASGGIQIPNLYPGWNARNFSEIRADENAHVAFLRATLGSDALPPPLLNTRALTIPTANPIFFASYAAVFENTGALTYFNSAPLIYNKEYTVAAASIYGVECSHSGYLNTLVDFPLTPNGGNFLAPFPISATLQNITPYLVDPTSTVALANSISTTPSPANDIKILNFALILELLEQAFYNINVRRFFNI